MSRTFYCIPRKDLCTPKKKHIPHHLPAGHVVFVGNEFLEAEPQSPIVRLFFSESPAHIWEDDGVVHTIRQGKGGEQGDPVMPLLFCVSHSALEAIQFRVNDFSRAQIVWCHSRTGHNGRARVVDTREDPHHAGPHVEQVGSQAGRCAMSCSGEPCCMIRQHRFRWGLVSPRGAGD